MHRPDAEAGGFPPFLKKITMSKFLIEESVMGELCRNNIINHQCMFYLSAAKKPGLGITLYKIMSRRFLDHRETYI